MFAATVTTSDFETSCSSTVRPSRRVKASAAVAATPDFEVVVTRQHRYMGAGEWTGGAVVLARSWGLGTCTEGRSNGFHGLSPTCSGFGA